MKRLACVASALLVGVATAGAAHAEPAAGAEAEARFSRGVQLYERGSYGAALNEFRAAYSLRANYRVLFNIAQLHAHLGDPASAVRAYERYLAAGANDIAPRRRAEVTAELARLAGAVGRIVVRCDAPDVEILVDDAIVGTTPLAAPHLVNAGRHAMVARRAGKAIDTQAIDVAAGEQSRVDVDAREPAPAPRSVEPAVAARPLVSPVRAEPPDSRAVPWFPWAAAGALAASAVVTGVLASNKLGAYDEAKARFGVTRAELEDAQRSARGFVVATGVLAAATAVGTGVALYMTLTPRSPKNVEVGFGAATLWMKGRF